MNKKELIDLGITEDVAEKVIVLHGKDIESHKQKLTTAETELTNTKAQLTEAGKAIESFKSLNVDQIKASADDYKAKFEKAQTDGAAAINKIKFDHALEKELKEFKVKDPADVIPHLKADKLQLGEDGKFIGLKEQIEPLKSSKDYLFDSDTPTPTVVTGGHSKSVANSDPFVDIVRKAAGLKTE
jgi:hypothetical protein